jgi:hypothetical protein
MKHHIIKTNLTKIFIKIKGHKMEELEIYLIIFLLVATVAGTLNMIIFILSKVITEERQEKFFKLFEKFI